MKQTVKRHKIALFVACAALITLSACEGTKKQLGLEKTSPDEFQVVKRAPLEMPPTYSLRPPQPGAPRPQEQATVEAARETVFGEQGNASRSISSTEGALLQQAGATQVDPNIRAKVDRESAEIESKKPVVKKLLNIGKDEEPGATIVDADKELERLQENEAEGKPVTEGETPSIEQ